MDLRLVLASLTFALSTATAQQGGDVPSDVPAKKVAQKPQEGKKDPATVITQLRAEKERLEKEIAYARERAARAKEILTSKLKRRERTFESIDAGTQNTVPAQPVAMKKARIMTAKERAALPEDVMMTIDGVPLHQSEYDRLMDYLDGVPSAGPKEVRSQRVMFELIRIKSVQAAFPENDAEGLISEVFSELQQNKPISEIAEKYGKVLGTQADGTLEVTRNSFLGTTFEQIAFALEPGQRSKPFRNVFGFVVFEPTEFVKGSEPALDKVIGRAVQVKYQGDEKQMGIIQGRASRGQVEILVRDASVLDLLPVLYRPNVVNIGNPERKGPSLKERLEDIEGQIRELKKTGVDAPDTKSALEALEKQADALRKALKSSKDTDARPGDSDAAPVKKALDSLKKK